MSPAKRTPLWTPAIPAGDTPLYLRLADAIERDIRAGTLAPGARLPPHRELAFALSVSVGTVTKAYGEAERRGLLAGHVGRGSFVAGPAAAPSPAHAPPDGPIDLARNVPAGGPTADHLAQALAALRRSADLASAIEYTLPQGTERGRRAGAQWLHRRHGLPGVDPAELIFSNGAQHGMALVLNALARPADTILCEAATFHGMKTLAEVAGYRLHGVALDAEGLVPDALEEAIATSRARVLYTIPTLQNPTTATMGAARRKTIVALARKHDLMIVEDDTYRATALPDAPPPTLSELAPERTAYLCTISKALTPGLRVGYIRPPNDTVRARILRAVRGTGYVPPALGALVFSEWVESGLADTLADRVLAEAQRRTALARRIFGAHAVAAGSRQSLHVWLPMPQLDAERAAGRALRAGVEVTPPDAPIVAAETISGLRLCLGGPADAATLEHALGVVAQALRGEVSDEARAVV